jgi:hypothetical protein
MPDHRHFTTRRGFVAALAFGGVSLYGAWATWGAAPTPFTRGPAPAPTLVGPGHGHAAGTTESVEDHAEAPGPTPEAFLRAHDDFLRRFTRADGAVDPHTPAGADGHGHADAAHGGGERGHREPGGHGGGGHDEGGHGGEAAAVPTDVWLLATRFAYSPDLLRLKAGVPYRLRMMAEDVTHGASIRLGPGSRIIRLRPNRPTEQTLTFTRPGGFLVYCTAYCGPGHDLMQGRILVA